MAWYESNTGQEDEAGNPAEVIEFLEDLDSSPSWIRDVQEEENPAEVIEFLEDLDNSPSWIRDVQEEPPNDPGERGGEGSDQNGGPNGSALGPQTSSDGKKLKQPREENTTLVRIFYVTDRKSVRDKITGIGFTAARSKTGLNFGQCEISIPKLHQTGHLESPSILRLEFRPNPKKHIVLATVTTMEEQTFLEKIAEVVAHSPKKEAFIFVHGYNVTFEDAARRTGQFAFDLKFSGAPVLYSWPSNGNIPDYPADENNAIWTVLNLTRFLSLLIQNTAAKRIHIIAHSMGNRAVCDALKSLSMLTPDKKALLHHLVLAAPDIDADIFRNLASALTQTSGHVTLYASSRDKAIKASKLLHKNPRAGAPPMVISPPMDSIDASSVKTDFFSHGYFGDSWPVLNDIYELVENDRPAADRFALIETTSAEGGVYYVFKP